MTDHRAECPHDPDHISDGAKALLRHNPAVTLLAAAALAVDAESLRRLLFNPTVTKDEIVEYYGDLLRNIEANSEKVREGMNLTCHRFLEMASHLNSVLCSSGEEGNIRQKSLQIVMEEIDKVISQL